jgi:tRNA pseudouridine55 synthase
MDTPDPERTAARDGESGAAAGDDRRARRGGRRHGRGHGRRRGRDVHGVLVLDKPPGMSSNEALQEVKFLYGAQKAGHTGSLDPLATGVLPLCFGDATKLSQFLLNSDKEYWARVRLGVRTDSGDADGKVLEERPVGALGLADVQAALARFVGEIEQVPSMYSAVKHQGQPLYKLARAGLEVERKARRVTIYESEVLAFSGDSFDLRMRCSKGTYVRTLAEEVGEVLGCGGHVTALRRLAAGPYREADAVTLDRLREVRSAAGHAGLDALLAPVWSAVGDLPEVTLVEVAAYYLLQGQPVQVAHAPKSGCVRLLRAGDGEREFLGVGEVLDDGRIAPRRLLAVN